MGVEGVLWSGLVSDALSGIIALIALRIYWEKIFKSEVTNKSDVS